MTIYPAPKPAPREKAPKPKKPRTPLKRGDSARLSRSGPGPTTRTPMKKVNRERLDKRTKAYRAYMASPEWKAKRAACLARDEYTCQVCGYKKGPGLDAIGDVIEDRQLHAAHLTYARFGHELLEDLVTKCSDCHLNREHAMNAIRPRGLRGGRA